MIYVGSTPVGTGNQPEENLSGVAIRRGQDHPDEYGKVGGQDVKRGVAHNTPISGNAVQIRTPCDNLLRRNA